MKIPGLLFLPLCCAVAAAPAGVSQLIEEARAAPAELASDALIRIAGTNPLEDARKVELLEDAFRRASGAPEPYRRHSALARNDGLAGYWNRVYAQDLDALTLQVRAVSAMLPLDARKARELFLRIPPLKLPHVTCDEYLVYDVGRFYQLLERIARESGEPGPFLKPYAAAIGSAVQVSPLVRTMLAARLSDSDLEALTNTFAAALGKIGGDDRSFTAAQSVGKDVLDLVEEMKARHLSPLRVVEAYRLYLIWNLSAARCGDDDLMQSGRLSFGAFTGQPADQQAGNYVTFFNTRLRMPPLQPIGEAEATPARLEGAATGLRVCQDPECRKVVESLRAVVIGNNGIPYRPSERTPEWQARLRGLLAQFEDWKERPGTDPAEFFREKAQIYNELFSLTADGPGGELVMRSILAFAAASEMRKTHRLEWFLPVNAVLGRLSLDPLGLGKYAGEVRQMKDPVIAFCARVEAVAPRTPDRILPLL